MDDPGSRLVDELSTLVDAVTRFYFHSAWLGYKCLLLQYIYMNTQQQQSPYPSPRFAGPTRVEVTGCQTKQLPMRVEANNIDGTTVYLERRGGKTFIVADPTE